MSVASLAFALFAACVLGPYYLLGQRAQNWWLLAASYGFYAFLDWRLPVVLAAVTLLNWTIARRLRAGGRAWFWAGIVANVLVVVVARQETGERLGPMIGLSFYMMQAISYLADVRAGVLRGPLDLVDLALYLAYFPRLLAGPIERASLLIPQLAAPRVVDNATAARALARIAEGMVRKIVLGDSLAALVPPRVLEHPELFPAGTLAWALIATTLAMYNDFAGYTQIVRGVSGLFGIELTPNFLQPQFSRSFTEFWTRWHVSLSRWLRDYIYLPLSRVILRRAPRARSIPVAIVPPFAAMLASGFWHGGSAGMLLWGALHGLFLAVERLWAFWRPRRAGLGRPAWVQGLQMLVVFILGTLAMVPFRMPVPAALACWRQLLVGGGWEAPDVRLVLLATLTLALDAVQYRGGEVVFLRWPQPVGAALLALAVALSFLLAERPPPPFVYQGF